MVDLERENKNLEQELCDLKHKALDEHLERIEEARIEDKKDVEEKIGKVNAKINGFYIFVSTIFSGVAIGVIVEWFKNKFGW